MDQSSKASEDGEKSELEALVRGFGSSTASSPSVWRKRPQKKSEDTMTVAEDPVSPVPLRKEKTNEGTEEDWNAGRQGGFPPLLLFHGSSSTVASGDDEQKSMNGSSERDGEVRMDGQEKNENETSDDDDPSISLLESAKEFGARAGRLPENSVRWILRSSDPFQVNF